MDFDEYFGRFRCFDPDCGWMATSSVEREIQLLRSHRQPERLVEKRIEELNITLTCDYDLKNDAIVVNFGLNEPTFELPEGDGRMFWKIGHVTGSVAGFTILGAEEIGISEIKVDVAARKQTIERNLRGIPGAIAAVRATKILIEKVLVEARTEKHETPKFAPQMRDAFQEALNIFSTTYLNNKIPERDHVPL